MARYHEIADDLRARIKAGEWKVGDKLPGISALQDHYQVEKSLGTIRSAQQLLVADGMLRTEQGVGAFLTATEPAPSVLDLAATLNQALDLLTDALTAVRTTKGKITFDLADNDRCFVLDTALQEFAARVRAEAQAEAEEVGDDFGGAARIRQRWVETAERMRTEIEAALN